MVKLRIISDSWSYVRGEGLVRWYYNTVVDVSHATARELLGANLAILEVDNG